MDVAAPASLVDFAPALRLALLALVVAMLPLGWLWLRQRGKDTPARVAALTALTAFLTFDLIVFGAFTRLTDSGLGCPDWPGCYGEATPLGARDEIHAAQSVMPSGPVTWTKAWIEMIHRYLAMTVGVLILVTAAVSWLERRRLPHSPWWPTVTLAWVIVQGLFGKYTVTLKLYPAIVTLHLLGGMLLLALLVAQRESWAAREPLAMPRTTYAWIGATAAATWLQIALGGWVSTNYAVLACRGFPACNGSWWPAPNFAEGFTLLRELGRGAQGHFLPFDALVAIHLAHRAMALLLMALLLVTSISLWRHNDPAHRRFAAALGALAVWQLASGLSNVVLDWPIVAALAHTAGAAALVAVTTSLMTRARPREPVVARASVCHGTAA